ncbi:MAG: hypothetical protein GX174_03090 [Lentisphaerae bacterium]|nr:hypothetical protein [Lentisphaerota bacterium]
MRRRTLPPGTAGSTLRLFRSPFCAGTVSRSSKRQHKLTVQYLSSSSSS